MNENFNNQLVSVIIPTYNCEEYISETIESVLKQTYKNLELIIVDDNSNDQTKKIIQQFSKKDSRLKFFLLEENRGAAYTRNFGLKEAKGRYIAFLDSDDKWLSEKLKKQLEFMKENQRYGFTFTNYCRVNVDGEILNSIHVPKMVDYKKLLKNTIIGCSTVVIDRKIIGDFRMVNLRKGQDTATWLKILKNNNCAYGLNEELTIYTVRKDSISANKLGALKRTWHIYREIEKIPLTKSLFYFFCYVKNAIKKRKKF